MLQIQAFPAGAALKSQNVVQAWDGSVRSRTGGTKVKLALRKDSDRSTCGSGNNDRQSSIESVEGRESVGGDGDPVHPRFVFRASAKAHGNRDTPDRGIGRKLDRARGKMREIGFRVGRGGAHV